MLLAATGHVNFSTSLRGGGRPIYHAGRYGVTGRDSGCPDRARYVLPHPTAVSCPVGGICNASDTARQKPAVCPDVGEGRVSSQVLILSTSVSAARAIGGAEIAPMAAKGELP